MAPVSPTIFTPTVSRWFEDAFPAPTPAQEQAWPAIAAGEHVLLSAPTGSGKTLAAFLWALDQLAAERARGIVEHATQLVYVSPLKALSYDIERNLRAPLKGISPALAGADLRVAIRTGDTPQRERAQMLRQPPDILITTPESLYLMLTSRAREILRPVRWVVVDEIHAVAATKRGAHLALTLERLDALAERPVQRIGLSATQRPLEEVARFLVGSRRSCRIVDAGAPRELDLTIHVPVESMTELDGPVPPPEGGPGQAPAGAPGNGDPLDPLAGGESLRGSIWPAIYPELLAQIRAHRSTIVFVNNRRSAERLALRLNELAGEDLARAHHGSLAREERLVVEELLKAGEIPCIVATSSLELGIDMGAVDLVLQVESPKSVAAGLQRIGRAGHGVGQRSEGRIFPKFRADLLECAVVARRMREGAIERTVVPRNPLDVLAQQIVAIAAAESDAGAAGGPGEAGGTAVAGEAGKTAAGAVSVDELYALVTGTHTYAELPRRQFEHVLDMLDGRYPSSEFAELRPRIVWDRLGGTIRARRGARQLAVVNAGTIPDRGLYLVTLPDGRRVGELDEEMVYEARPGQVFLLGASAWRIEEIGRDRVVVTPAPGAPGAVPFWKGDGVGRPRELGEAIGAFARWAIEQESETLQRDYDLDRRAAANLLAYLREQQAATRVLPSDRTIVLERFRDEIGDWRLCLLSPFGGRVHAAWALALSARIRDRLGLEADAIWSDDGVALHLPDADEPPEEDLVRIDPDELEQLVVAELGSTALFGARFREAAARALLLPRAYPGKRTPLWQQRLKAQKLLEVARRHGDFPIVLEAYRECLRDVLDLPGLGELLTRLQRRQLSLVSVETASASPFASSLLFDYVATYMYEGDAPSAERRAAALSLDRDLLRELLGQEELRELIDPGALRRLEDDLQRRSEHTRAANREELHDTLRLLGDLNLQEAAERVHPGVDVASLLDGLEHERRAVRLRLAGVERFVDAADAGLYRDALGAVPPGGLPDAFLADVPDALLRLLARYAATHGPFTTAQARDRHGLPRGAVEAALRSLQDAGDLVRGELHPEPTEEGREWCDIEVLRRLRRASLAALRSEIEPAEHRAFARFLPAWHGIGQGSAHARGGGGVERLREALVPLQGLALTPRTWEREVLPRRLPGYSPAWLDELCAGGELVWVGAGALGRNDGRVALYFRADAGLLGPPPGRRESDASGRREGDASGRRESAASGRREGEASGRREGEARESDESDFGGVRARVRARLNPSGGGGPCFFTDLLADVDVPAVALEEALWALVWAGEVTNDAFAPLRARRLALAAGARAGSRAPIAGRLGGGRRAGLGEHGRAGAGRSIARTGGRAPVHLPGRWSLAGTLFDAAPAFDPAARRRALAELLLERHGILTRELVLAEGVQGGFAALYPELCRLETLGLARRGYFVEGLGGAQFALPGAVERLRGQPPGEGAATRVLAATDPAQPYGSALPWPRRGPARVPGAVVVLLDGEAALYLERGGRGLRVLLDDDADEGRLETALDALAADARAGLLPGRLALERVDGASVLGGAWEQRLVRAGFRAGPRRLTLSA
ncbi:MAG TPA: DEAD/DEAH box helicase [Solirubrobacteraceae bacterium]|nr:DEAD/DEAH box helicase [Solirubrobacteraceae bacterium]